MTKTALLVSIALLLSACIEPNPGAVGMDEAETETGGMDPSSPDADSDESSSGGDETGDDDDEGETGEAGETGEPDVSGCDPETHQCVDVVPQGWQGPARLAADPEECGAGWAIEKEIVHATASGDPAVCGCECEPTGGECSVEVTDYPELCLFGECGNVNVCDVANNTHVVTDNTNLGYSGPQALGVDISLIADSLAMTDSGACEAVPSSATEVLPDVEYGGIHRLCELDDPYTACDGSDICVPNGDDRFEAGICIWTFGDEPCPADGFTERTVLFDSHEDNRSCGACQCGEEVVGADCSDSRVELWTPLGTFADFPADGQCHSFDLPGNEYAVSVHLEPNLPAGGTCDANSDPQGAVEAATEVTVCCTP